MTPHSSARLKNHVLAALPDGEWRLMEPHLKWVELPLGAMLYEAGVVLRQVYFPVTAIVSLVSSMKDGASAEVAVVGNEGVVGVCAFLGGGRALSGAVVQSAGHAFQMTAESIACHAWQSEPVMQQLLRYTQALFTHMAQTSACNRHHVLDQKLCRWLLLNLDRRDGNEMIVTQEKIADMLGVRRGGVTASALKLQKAGLIQYHRGRVSVLDRAGLEARSCECYSVVRQAYDRLWASAAMHWHGSAPARRIRSNQAGHRGRDGAVDRGRDAGSSAIAHLAYGRPVPLTRAG
jgi:CRP-like cAMP-binding protein